MISNGVVVRLGLRPEKHFDGNPFDFQSVYSSASTTASSSTPSPPLADNIEHACVSNVAAFSSSGAAQKSNPTLRKPKEGTSVKQRKRKRKKKKSSLPTQIVVGNYSSDFDTALLLNYFEDYCGNVKSYDFGYMLGELNFGFITFTDVKSVEKAAALSNTIVFGETISVTVQNKNKTKTSKVEVSNKLVIKNCHICLVMNQPRSQGQSRTLEATL